MLRLTRVAALSLRSALVVFLLHAVISLWAFFRMLGVTDGTEQWGISLTFTLLDFPLAPLYSWLECKAHLTYPHLALLSVILGGILYGSVTAAAHFLLLYQRYRARCPRCGYPRTRAICSECGLTLDPPSTPRPRLILVVIGAVLLLACSAPGLLWFTSGITPLGFHADVAISAATFVGIAIIAVALVPSAFV